MEDYMIRATAAGNQIRAFACSTRDMVEKARQAHNTSPVITAALGRLLTAGVMMGSMLKGEQDLLTIKVKGEGPVKGLTVTADSMGHVKGYPIVPDVILPANSIGKLDVAGAIGPGTLTVIKDMGLKEPYSGQVELQTGEIAEDVTYYFAVSEQVPSCVGLGVLMEKNNTVKQAGGFIVQLMPFAEEETIARLEENIKGLKSVTTMLEEGNTPEDILGIVLEGLDLEIMDGTLPVEFRCDCSRERVERALISLGKKELQDMITEGKEIEVGCQFCGRQFQFSVEELRKLYGRARRP